MNSDATGRPLVDGLSRLIADHGREAVKDAARKLTAPPRGRRPVGHWKLLAPELIADAANWLSGSPRKSNTAIAKRVAAKYPGQSEASTLRQLQAKLATGRLVRMFEFAVMLTSADENFDATGSAVPANYPFAQHFHALEALSAIDPLWCEWLAQERAILERHRELYGEPEPSKTWAEVRAKVHFMKRGLLGTAFSRRKP